MPSTQDGAGDALERQTLAVNTGRDLDGEHCLTCGKPWPLGEPRAKPARKGAGTAGGREKPLERESAGQGALTL